MSKTSQQDTARRSKLLVMAVIGATLTMSWAAFRVDNSLTTFVVAFAAQAVAATALAYIAHAPSNPSDLRWFGFAMATGPWLLLADSPFRTLLVFTLALLSAITIPIGRRLREGKLAVLHVMGLIALSLSAGYVFLLGSVLASGGGAWGRPLRIRGRQVHPNLRRGADWTRGTRPDPRGLDEPTRAALEALWLHDAQKEHASVPAFSRLSWMLAAVGAPARLLAGCHRAALEEIDHTERCFALAAGYAGRSFTVEAMPELLLGGLDSKTDPLATLAVESLSDGCQLEDFNADVAGLCAAVCEEPVTRDVLERIAREERCHAELSWHILEFALTRDTARVRPALERALARLESYPRPTAVSADKAQLVSRADQAALRRHGRLQDVEWAAAWSARLEATRARVHSLLESGQRLAS